MCNLKKINVDLSPLVYTTEHMTSGDTDNSHQQMLPTFYEMTSW